jgi:uncharacterized protein (DUF488 family)
MSPSAAECPSVVLTIGHSTRPLEELVGILEAHGVRHLADVRTIPRSRHNPQFNRDRLVRGIPRAGIGYTHMPVLGGLRHARPDSPNQGWRNASFRGFADYMQTPEFEAGLGALIEAAARARTAIMCAEAVPWRCHRSLIADALCARGVLVEHILSATRAEPHVLTAFATVEGTRVTYPPLLGKAPTGRATRQARRSRLHVAPPSARSPEARRKKVAGAGTSARSDLTRKS